MTEKIDKFVDSIILFADNAPRDKDMEVIRDVASEVLQGKDHPETGDTKRAVSMLEDRGVIQTYQWRGFYNAGYTFMPGSQLPGSPPSRSFFGGPIARRIFEAMGQVAFTGEEDAEDAVALCQAAERGVAVGYYVRNELESTEMMVYAPVPLREHEWERDVPDARGEEVSLAENVVYHAAFRAASEHPEKYAGLAQIEKAVMEGLRLAGERTSGDGAPETATTA